MIKNEHVYPPLRQGMPGFYVRIATSLFIGALLVFSPALNQARSLISAPNRSGGTLRIKDFGNVFRTDSDPALGRNIFITEQIYDGLVRLDKNFNLVPELAEYWSISEGGKVYTFYLRKGVKFHNGRELTAEDVKFSLQRLILRATNSPYYQFFTARVTGALEFREGKTSEVTGFKVKEKYVFEIQWNEPYVSCLYLMSMSFSKVLPRELVEKQGSGFFQRPLGTGPFKFAYWIRSPRLDIVGVRLERNEGYFGGKPYLDAVELSPFFTVENFIAREVDIIPFLSNRLARSGYRVISSGSFDLVYLGMSCHLPPLDRVDVRKSLALAIDKTRLSEATSTIDTNSQLIDNYIPAKLPGFFPLEIVPGHDPQKAKGLLEKQGFSSEKPPPPLVLYSLSPRTDFEDELFRDLKEQLSSLGISLRLEYYWNIKEVRTSKVPYLILMDWAMDFPDPENIIRPLFSSSSLLNLFGYASRRVDDLLARADVEQSWTKRIELFLEIERVLSEELPAIPLFSRERRVAVQPYVKGAKIPPLGLSYLEVKDIWLDK